MNPVPTSSRAVERGGLILLALAAAGLAAVLYAANFWFGNLNQDEGWYLYAARAWAQGRLPYRDYFFTQGPMLPGFYGALTPLWSAYGVAGGRALTVLLGLGGALLTGALAASGAPRGRRAAAAITAFLLTAGNVYHSYFTTIPKTYALAALFLTAGVLTLAATRAGRRTWLAALAGVLLAAAAGTRLSLGAALLGAGLWLLWHARTYRNAWFWFGCGGMAGLAAVYGPSLVLAPDAFWFANTFHTAREGGGLLFAAGSVSRLLRGYLPLAALALVTLAWRGWVGRGRAAGVPARDAGIATSLGPVVFVAVWIVQLVSPYPYDDYQVPIMPLLAAATSAGLWELAPRPGAPRAARAHLGLLAAVFAWCAVGAFSSPLNQDWFVIRQDRFWVVRKPVSDLARLREVGRRVRALTPESAPLLTQDTYLAVEAGRRVPAGFEMGPFGYFPDLDDATAARYHVLNRAGLLASLRSGASPLAAFSGYGLAIGAPKMVELAPDAQVELHAALAERYVPLLTVADFGQGHTPAEALDAQMTLTTPKSLGHRVLRASLAVGIAHGLFKLAGIIQALAMARYLPPGTYEAVYVFAFEGCIFSLFLVGEEALGPALMPVFMRELDTAGERAAWRFANVLLTLQIMLLALVVAVLMTYPEWVARIWTQWSSTHKPETFAMGARSVRALAPALIGLSLGSTTYVLLNAHKRFFLAAFGDAIWKFAVAAALVAGVGMFGLGAEALIWGVVAGSVLKLATHLVGLRDKLRLLRPSLDVANPALRRMLWLTLPLLVGIVFAKVRDNVNNVYLLSALDTEGLMQANSMGRKLQGTIHFLVPYALSIAVFPYFCELVDRNDHAQLGGFVTRSGRILLALFVPFAVVTAALALPLTGFLFAGGHFDDLAVRRTAVATACYTLVLPAAAIEALVMQAFFANRRMVAVTVAGIGFSTLSMAVSWLGLRYWSGHDLLLLATIAGGYVLSRILKSWVLVLLLGRHTPVFPVGPTLAFLGRLALVTAAAGGAAWFVSAGCGRWAAVALSGRMVDLARLAGGGAAALAAGAAACAVLGVHEPLELVRLVQGARRLRGSRRAVSGGGPSGD